MTTFRTAVRAALRTMPRSRGRRYALAALVACVGVSSTAALAAQSAAGDTSHQAAAPGITKTLIKLGATSIRSGAVASACEAEVTGAASWISKINKSGGVFGRKISWTVLDDGNDAARAANNARTLVEQQKVFALFNGCGSTGAAAILPLVDQNKIPYLFPNALSQPVLRPPHDTVVTFVPLYSQQLAAILPWMYKKHGPGKVALIYIPGLDPKMQPAVEAVTADAGGKVVAEIPAAFTTTDWGPTVLKIQQADPDYVVFGTSTAQAGQIVAQMARQGYKPKFLVGMQSLGDAIYWQTAGSIADTISFASTPVVAPSDKQAAQCNAALPKGLTSSMYTLIGCASAQLMVSALQQAGKNPTRASLLAAVAKWKRNAEHLVLPPVSFNATHLLIQGMYVVQVVNGQSKTVARVPIPPQWGS
jgi:branched-chain amino acid transport system substrate-binding protein